MHYVKVIIVF